ncbi:MAG: pyridoxal phosphate-dependent aminotransferase [Acidimicrobiales bacterium]
MTEPPGPAPHPQVVERMRGFGSTIFGEMSALAVATDSVNLGQGFPDTDGPASVLEAAVDAIRAGHNQYPPAIGIPELRHAIAGHRSRRYGLDHDPDREVLVTAGATEAIAASLLALCEPGDEVVAFEPLYDSYAASIALAGGVRVPVTLRAPDFRPDLDRFAAAIGPRARLVLVNSPHNPTGMVLRRDELAEIARLCVEHDLIAITDEVYEHLVFEGEHVPLASFPGMRDRTVSISSAGKTFAVTGWKIGWVCASEPLVTAVRTVKQYLTYVNGAPFQYAIAGALDAGDQLVDPLVEGLRQGRDQLIEGLAATGMTVYQPAGTYFATADIAPLGETDGVEFCRRLPHDVGVVAIPSSVFYDDEEAGRTLVRFAFCKRPEVLAEAIGRLGQLGQLGLRRGAGSR